MDPNKRNNLNRKSRKFIFILSTQFEKNQNSII